MEMVTIPKTVWTMVSGHFVFTYSAWFQKRRDDTAAGWDYADTDFGRAEEQRMRDTLAYILEESKRK